MKDFMTVAKFSNTSKGAKQLIEAMKDYAKHDRNESIGTKFSVENVVSMEQKSKAINKMYIEQLQKMSGYTVDTFNGDIERFAKFPLINQFAQTLSDILIDAVMPYVFDNSALNSICEMHYAGYGQSFNVTLEDNTLYKVGNLDRRMKHGQTQRKERNSVPINTQPYGITIISNLPEYMLGNASVARDTMIATLSMQRHIYGMVLNKFKEKMNGITISALKLDNWDELEVIKRLQTVSVYNNAKAIIVGDAIALKKVLPAGQGQRILLQDEFNTTLGHLRTFNGYDVMSFEPVASGDKYGLTKLPENIVYAISPSARKMIHVAIGNTMSNTDGMYDNANLGVLSTIRKEIGVEIATTSIASKISTATA